MSLVLGFFYEKSIVLLSEWHLSCGPFGTNKPECLAGDEVRSRLKTFLQLSLDDFTVVHILSET